MGDQTGQQRTRSGLLCFRESGLPGTGGIQQRLHQTPAMRRGLLGDVEGRGGHVQWRRGCTYRKTWRTHRELGPRETLNLWCGDQMRVWTVLVTYEPSPPGLLRFSDSVLKTPYLSNTKCLLVSLYIFTIPDLTVPCISPFRASVFLVCTVGDHQDLPCKVARN